MSVSQSRESLKGIGNRQSLALQILAIDFRDDEGTDQQKLSKPISLQSYLDARYTDQYISDNPLFKKYKLKELTSTEQDEIVGEVIDLCSRGIFILDNFSDEQMCVHWNPELLYLIIENTKTKDY